MIPLLLVVALGALAFWFVSSSDDGLEGKEEVAEDQPGAPVVAWWTAMAQEDSEAACKQLAAAAIERETADGTTCVEAMTQQNRGGTYRDGFDLLIIEEVVKGDRAEVVFNFKGNPLPDDSMLAVREGGTWKVDPHGDTMGIDACRTEQRAVAEAIGKYWDAHRELPPDLQSLVDEGLLKELPPNMELAGGGHVDPINDCA